MARKAGKLALPVICGLALPQAYPLINTWFASTLAVGVISHNAAQQHISGPQCYNIIKYIGRATQANVADCARMQIYHWYGRFR